MDIVGFSDIFTNQVADIHKIGSNYRFVFSSPYTSYDGREIEHPVVARLLIPAEALAAISHAIATAASPVEETTDLAAVETMGAIN